jgi:hypothetical protein
MTTTDNEWVEWSYYHERGYQKGLVDSKTITKLQEMERETMLNILEQTLVFIQSNCRHLPTRPDILNPIKDVLRKHGRHP